METCWSEILQTVAQTQRLFRAARDEAEGELDGVCSDCKKVRRKVKILQAKRKDLVYSAKARRQEASSKVIYFQIVFLRY